MIIFLLSCDRDFTFGRVRECNPRECKIRRICLTAWVPEHVLFQTTIDRRGNKL